MKRHVQLKIGKVSSRLLGMGSGAAEGRWLDMWFEVSAASFKNLSESNYRIRFEITFSDGLTRCVFPGYVTSNVVRKSDSRRIIKFVRAGPRKMFYPKKTSSKPTKGTVK